MNAGMRKVPLLLGPPPTELARELAQVRYRARALADYIQSTNAPFPEDFPKADILAIAAEMIELPDGTAQGCLPPLEYVDVRLSDIRSLHFPATTPAQAPGGDHAPVLARDEGLDRDLSGLIVAVATARRVANRIAAIEPEEKVPESSVSRDRVSELVDLESKGARLKEGLTESRGDFDECAVRGSEHADQFRRTLTDAKVIAGLSRIELAQQNIIPAWLRRFGGWLSNYPTRLEDAGRVLEDGVDVATTVHGGWRKLKSRLTDAVYSSLHEFSIDLQGLGRRLEERRTITGQAESFSLSKLKLKILAGETPPETWTKFVDELDFSRSPLRELTPLKGLTKLQSLNLSRAPIIDLAPLCGLTGLENLDLSGTEVTDLAALESLTALQSLRVASTPVNDLSPIRALTALQLLDLAFTRVTDFSGLQSLPALRSLYLGGDKITDLSALRGMKDLESLYLACDRVTDLSPVRNLIALQTLHVSGSNITDISPLRNLTALQTLVLSAKCSDLSPLKTLTALTSLNLTLRSLTDVSPLQTLTTLQTLTLFQSGVSDLSPVQSLTSLQRLSFFGSPVSDISPLRTLTRLKSLDLSQTKVSDLSPLKSLTALTNLDLGFTRTSDVSPLKGLTALETLDLQNTPISNLAPLAGLRSLRVLNIRGVREADISVLAHLETLRIET
jgi:Leucine-rich repeat (LRR) protein